MNYFGAVLYFWLFGSALLLLMKLLASYPSLAAIFAVVCAWVAWELFRESQDQHNSTRKQDDK